MNMLKKTTLSLDTTHFRYASQVLSIQTFLNIYIIKQYIKMNDQTISMWINTWMNNNNNIILKDSLESLHQREFSLQSSQQLVVLAFHYHERFTKIKVGWKGRKWIETDWSEPRKQIFLALASLISSTSWFFFLM